MKRVRRKQQFNINPILGVKISSYNDNAQNTQKFIGQEKDNTTGYDYMHFRYYASSMGRFLKPDNLITNSFNPQSWNLYSYCNGNPVNFNDPGGHYANVPGGTKKSYLGPPGGSVWDMLAGGGVIFDESVFGGTTGVAHYDWVSGGDSTASGQEEEKIDPLASIPDASTLPEDQRNAYVIHGVGNSSADASDLPGTAVTGAGEATDKLMNLGYQVHTIQFESNKQIKAMAKEGLFKGAIVIISAHFDKGYFWWGSGLQQTSGRSMAKLMGLSGASEVRYLTCNSWRVAERTRQIGRMKTWGAKGFLNIKFMRAIPPPNIPINSNLTLLNIDYWFLTKKIKKR